MELTGEVLMAAPRERVWQALNDAAVLRECIPGCEEVQDDSPTERRVRVMVKVGPVRARFNGKVTLSEVEAPQRCVMAFEGSGGAAGMASGQSRVELVDAEGGTTLSYTVKASVGGKLGQIGGRMIDASAKQLADQFFDKLRAHLAPEAVPAAAGVIETVPPTAEAGIAAADAATAAPLAAGTAAIQGHPGTGSAGPVVAPPRGGGAEGASGGSEFSRVLWFVLGVASTGFGVWLGARLFH
ncbi:MULTISPECIES: carbon monoxide dehydrogenase subunit G [Ramlibacter]|uniref:Carbon monoxide dehydrogenase subunit G n=1 Tax=Ramlibacter aquaticus TaxID=2780094 RepID=A0ABR9SGI3_9BURK|nr:MULTISPECIES: carbon monoxide dehydrogenase subunit G [Ramlibacter]MBE7941294.1 carbon monoxide dehydrogenase subunit G [Ramlibacter aquaticus]